MMNERTAVVRVEIVNLSLQLVRIRPIVVSFQVRNVVAGEPLQQIDRIRAGAQILLANN
jgi:hypothetical protein